MPCIQITVVQTKKHQKPFIKSTPPSRLGPASVQRGTPTAHHVALVGGACEFAHRFSLSLSSVLEKIRLVRNCCKKKNLLSPWPLPPVWTLEPVAITQGANTWMGMSVSWDSELWGFFLFVLKHLWTLLVVAPDEPSLSRSLFLHLLNEGRTFYVFLYISGVVSFN